MELENLINSYEFFIDGVVSKYKRNMITRKSAIDQMYGATHMFHSCLIGIDYRDIEKYEKDDIFTWREQAIKLGVDDYGQQMTFIDLYKVEHGCGSYNFCYLLDVISVIDEQLNLQKLES